MRRLLLNVLSGATVGACACALTALAVFAASGEWVTGWPRATLLGGAIGGSLLCGLPANVWAVMRDASVGVILAACAAAAACALGSLAAGVDWVAWANGCRGSALGCLLVGTVAGAALGAPAGALLGAVYRDDPEWWMGAWPTS